MDPKTYRKTAPVTAVHIDLSDTDPLPEDFLEAIAIDSCPGVPLDSVGFIEPHIHTLEGPLRIRSGDWLVKGPNGEFWPVRGDIFESSYEPVDEYDEEDK